jgi:hypothetical protein
MWPALDPAGHRIPRTKPTCLLHTWRPHRQRSFVLVLHLHQHKSSCNLHLQYLAKNQSTQRCQSLITQGSDHPPVLEPHMVLSRRGGLRHSQAAVSNGAGGVQGGGGSTRTAQGGRPFYRRRSPRQGPHGEGLGAHGLSTASQAQHAAARPPRRLGTRNLGARASCRVMASGRCVASGNAASGSAPALGARDGARTPRQYGARVGTARRGPARCGEAQNVAVCLCLTAFFSKIWNRSAQSGE